MATEFSSVPPSREKTLDRMAGIIQSGVEKKEKEHQQLLIAVRNIIAFGKKILGIKC